MSKHAQDNLFAILFLAAFFIFLAGAWIRLDAFYELCQHDLDVDELWDDEDEVAA